LDILENQKESVKIEALKVLGYMTSECLLNISSQTQVVIIQSLKKYTDPSLKNNNILRLALNCIGNILTHSNHKIAEINTELIQNVITILKDMQAVSKLEDSNNVKLLASLFRLMNALHLDTKVLDANAVDYLIKELMKYMYLGTSFFPI